MAATRARIVEAAVSLHTTVGPAATSLSDIAAAAGVTRLTVYRHFSNLEAVYEACSAHWASMHPSPAVEPWLAIARPEDRWRPAIAELYGWFADNGNDLLTILRDAAWLPESVVDANTAQARRWADALVAGVDGDSARHGRVRAVAGHVVGFWTWHSLVREQGLGGTAATEVVCRWLADAACLR